MSKLLMLLFLAAVVLILATEARPRSGRRGDAKKQIHPGRRAGEGRRKWNRYLALNKNDSAVAVENTDGDGGSIVDQGDMEVNAKLPGIRNKGHRRNHRQGNRRKGLVNRRRNNKAGKQRRLSMKHKQQGVKNNNGKRKVNRRFNKNRKPGQINRHQRRQNGMLRHKRRKCFCLSAEKLESLQQLIRKEGLESEFAKILSKVDDVDEVKEEDTGDIDDPELDEDVDEDQDDNGDEPIDDDDDVEELEFKDENDDDDDDDVLENETFTGLEDDIIDGIDELDEDDDNLNEEVTSSVLF